MELSSPLEITPSLLPGVRIADSHETGWLAIDSPREGESGLVIVITLPDGTDVRSDRFNPRSSDMRAIVECALSFLAASGESYSSRVSSGESEPDEDSSESLFPAPVPEFAYRFRSEIECLSFELSEQIEA